jgi:SM-20-related protein
MKDFQFPLCGNRTRVVDGQVPENVIGNFHNNCISLSFKRTARSYEGNNYPVFSLDLEPHFFCSKTIIGKTCGRLINDLFEDYEVAVASASVLIIFPGEEDAVFPAKPDPDKNSITAYYHINKEWEHSWGGEALFYEDGDTKLAVLPKPGRIVVFEGEPEHRLTAPRRGCPEPKLLLAIKYINP